jgi:hypothetical protein
MLQSGIAPNSANEILRKRTYFVEKTSGNNILKKLSGTLSRRRENLVLVESLRILHSVIFWAIFTIAPLPSKLEGSGYAQKIRHNRFNKDRIKKINGECLNEVQLG